MKPFLVMGTRFFRTSFSLTKTGQRATYFEPEPSHGTCLARFYCEQPTRKMHCRYDESLFGRDLTFCRPDGFSNQNSSQKECFALGAIDGAPSTGGAKQSLSTFFRAFRPFRRARKPLESRLEAPLELPELLSNLSRHFQDKQRT